MKKILGGGVVDFSEKYLVGLFCFVFTLIRYTFTTANLLILIYLILILLIIYFILFILYKLGVNSLGILYNFYNS